MKKLLAIVLIQLTSLAMINAQNKLASNHSIGINLLGIEYSYEQVLGSKCTIIGSAGATSTLGYMSGFNFGDTSYGGFFFNLSPIISVVPRFYYNRERRNKNGKSTALNTGNYLELKATYIFPQLYETGNFTQTSALIISPLWGMRRVYNEKWLLEFHAGLNFGINSYNDFGCSPALNLKFGYIF